MSVEARVYPTEAAAPLEPANELLELQRTEPVCPLRFVNGDVGWLTTSHELVKKVLVDSRFGKGDLGAGSKLRLRSPLGNPGRMAQLEAACDTYGDWRPLQGFISMDPPDHTHIRRLLAPHFTVRGMAAFQPEIERAVAERLDAMERKGPPLDLAGEFAAPVSLAAQCGLLGIPVAGAGPFHQIFSSNARETISAAQSARLWWEAREFVRLLAAKKRENPGRDVVSAIASGGELTDEEIADTALILFQAGLETTGDMLALGVFVVLRETEQLKLLRQGRVTLEAIVEELLRYVTPSHVLFRTALEDVELGGTLVREGETVIISLGAANRDPEKFAHADDFDPTRSAAGHVAFGQGIHMCLGQHLARFELQLGLGALIERFPGLRLAVPAGDIVVDGPMGTDARWSIRELPVTW